MWLILRLTLSTMGRLHSQHLGLLSLQQFSHLQLNRSLYSILSSNWTDFTQYYPDHPISILWGPLLTTTVQYVLYYNPTCRHQECRTCLWWEPRTPRRWSRWRGRICPTQRWRSPRYWGHTYHTPPDQPGTQHQWGINSTGVTLEYLI